jgi:uncharacterized protein with PQ loop repeat
VHPSPVLPSGHRPGFGNWRRRLLGSASIFTLVMTIPQVLNIWVGRRAAGVSVVSWSAYLVSALLWLWHRIRQRDRNIYLPCIGWIVLDSAVILGVIIYGCIVESSKPEFQRGFASDKQIMWTITQVHMKCFVGGAGH